jgi:hypothetical protein
MFLSPLGERNMRRLGMTEGGCYCATQNVSGW